MRGTGALTLWPPRMSNGPELAAAVLAAAASLTPSLLPKTVLVQGIVTGMAAAAGYALGALARWMLSPVRRRLSEATRVRIGWTLLGAASLFLIPAAWFGHVWQGELAASFGDPDPPATNAIGALLVAAVVVVVVVVFARAVRATSRAIAGALTRRVPQWAALAIGALALVSAVTAVDHGVGRSSVLETLDGSFRLLNRDRSTDLPAPLDPLRSGGPGSHVAWSTLGYAGRDFISLPDPPGKERPIRIYVGSDSSPDLQSRADLVVAELERTGALRRPVVCVVVATGTGWVDPAAVAAFEAEWGGNSAIASMQYSFLPSVLSLAIDQSRVDAAARALVGAVVRRWQALPESARPKLVLFGESLGSRGVEVAMRTVAGANEVVAGVLLAGPPNSNPTWNDLIARRDLGSPLLAPVVDGGRSVRFWPGPEMPDYDRTHDPWPAPPAGPRTLYLQHPSDPVVWWSTSLLWSEPGWVDERTQVTKAPPLRWRPIVTFWQVSGDTAFAAEVPLGHGHRYGSEFAAAWAVLAPHEK